MRRTGVIIAVLALVALLTAAAPAGSMSLNIVYGTDGNDTIVATPAADVIYAKSGNDRITGVGDGDVVWASSGNDSISILAGAGNLVVHDRIDGVGVHDSHMNGGSGNDSIKVNGCSNDVSGESGNDVYENFASCPSANTANLGNGHDKVSLSYASSILLGNGNDQLTAITSDYVHSSSGNDKVTMQDAADSVVYLGTGHDEVTMPLAAGVTLFGSDGNDKVSVGSGADNVFHGQSGNDTFTLESSTGPNVLHGNQNRDKARLGSVSGTSCHLIETVVDLAGARRSCS